MNKQDCRCHCSKSFDACPIRHNSHTCGHCEQDTSTASSRMSTDTSSEEQVQTWEEKFDKEFNFLGTYNQDELGKLTVNAVKYLELKDFIRKEKQKSYEDAVYDTIDVLRSLNLADKIFTLEEVVEIIKGKLTEK